MPVTKVFSNSFSEVTGKDLAWCDGMVTGNGVQGAVIACAPYSDTIIYQNIHFILPSDQPRHIPPEVGGELKEAQNLGDMLYAIFHSDIFYKSLMADHNTTGNFVYCTDTTLGILGIINEALVYSDDAVIELLPALPAQWKKGRVTGIMTRCGARIEELSWNLDASEIQFCISAPKDLCVSIRCMGKVIAENCRIGKNEIAEKKVAIVSSGDGGNIICIDKKNAGIYNGNE